MQVSRKAARTAVIATAVTALGGIGLTAAVHDQPGEAKDVGTVSAAKSLGKKKGIPCVVPGGRTAKYRHFERTEYVWKNEWPWRTSAWGPKSIDFKKGHKVSNTVTATLGAPIKSINATVGFQVTEEVSTDISHKWRLKKKRHYTLRMGQGFKVYKFNVYDALGNIQAGGPGGGYCVFNGKYSYVGSAYAKKFWTLDDKCTWNKKGKQVLCTAADLAY
ncbi:hypothetical protein ACFOY4_31640 [Actinomadura syzygii]|uniref:Uncharacterized protein n=1 Tax=Actinomadura syzygii TaxID=1427538 RepID=A0A5D0UAE7_9ACTN|nr:hypothetical protein [Actinomadura syzygii]TYC15318.1 hypothetical protein FXF65_14720 [Actinomadura syzygii]